MNYLDSLNTEQKRAVLATEGPVLIVAGAGAGKTKTLTHRILHLIQTGVAPERILAITFTNKAAKEMRERVMALLGRDPGVRRGRGIPYVSTFHSLCVQILKENAELLKLPRHFVIFDTSDSKKALKEACAYHNLDPKEHLDKIRHTISREKNRGTSLAEYRERSTFDYTSETTLKVWTRYEEMMRKEGALDFDDLLLLTLKLFEKYPDVLDQYQERFLYIHVDEYQDTNKVQNAMVELLARKYKNICVVGDTDQNIYSWRGAEIKNMLHFEKTYPGAQTIFLEQNYRSTKTILAAANEIIEKNNFRIPKKLFTENVEGEKINVFEARNEMDEAHFIAMKCKDLISGGLSPESIAVLYRANFQSRALEESFLAFEVPYQMVGTKFFERKEIKDIMSLIRVSLNPDAVSDFARVINIPPRGIGKTTLQKILSGKESELPESMKLKINSFRNSLTSFKEVLQKDIPSRALKYIIQHSGMEKMYQTGLEEDNERLENIMELVSLATEYDDLPGEPSSAKAMAGETGIEKFLTQSALASDADSLDGVKTGVKLMTVHASKGLEFEHVFICGLEDGLFPHTNEFQTKKSGEDGEEERRLFYVAVTRAGKKLFLTWAQTRTIFGTLEVNSESEFLEDIPEKYRERVGYEGSEYRKPLISIDF